MHKWILSWILPTLHYRSYFYIIFLVSAISFACNDMTPEQMATNVNCSTPERHTRSYDYMEGGNVRVRRLFCRTQWYIKIDKRGKIKGVLERNGNYSILEIRTVAVGIVAIKGVASEYFLAMNKSGKLYGKYPNHALSTESQFQQKCFHFQNGGRFEHARRRSWNTTETLNKLDLRIYVYF